MKKAYFYRMFFCIIVLVGDNCFFYHNERLKEYEDRYSGKSFFGGFDGFRCPPPVFNKGKRFQEMNECENDEWNFKYIRNIKNLENNKTCVEVCVPKPDKKFYENELTNNDKVVFQSHERWTLEESKITQCINKNLLNSKLFDLKGSGLFASCEYDSKARDCIQYVINGQVDSCLCAYYLHFWDNGNGEQYQKLISYLISEKCGKALK
ncbi:MAG: hypothetical protein IPL26_05380 [Leptospiraceae bacterium]|nr:hypothetical protein [Leptospiraceae bacterium]